MFIESKSQVKQLSTYKGIEPDSSNYSLSPRLGIAKPSADGVRDLSFQSTHPPDDQDLIPLKDMIHVFYYDRNIQMENIVFRIFMIS